MVRRLFATSTRCEVSENRWHHFETFQHVSHIAFFCLGDLTFGSLSLLSIFSFEVGLFFFAIKNLT